MFSSKKAIRSASSSSSPPTDETLTRCAVVRAGRAQTDPERTLLLKALIEVGRWAEPPKLEERMNIVEY